MHRPARLRPVNVLVLVLVLSGAAPFAACDTDGPPATPIDGHPTTLAGTSWIVAAIDGVRVTIGNGPTIAFDGQKAQGSGGCNQIGGSYRYDPQTGELRFDGLGMTAMACAEPERNAVETRFIQALGRTPLVARIEPDGHLALAGPAGGLDLAPASTDGG